MIKKYFLRANTASGEVNLIYDNLKGISNITILDGGCRTAKNRLLTRIAFLLSEKGKLVEGIMCPFDVGVYEGIIVRENRFAIFSSECAREIDGEKEYQYGNRSSHPINQCMVYSLFPMMHFWFFTFLEDCLSVSADSPFQLSPG